MARGRALRRGAACLCAVIGCADLAAQAPSPATTYGQSLYRLDDARSAWRPFRPVLPDAGSTSGALEHAIELQEMHGGPFSPELLEPLQSLGAARFAQGDFRGAGAAWDRALHLVRVNDGLQSPAQRWLLEQLSEASLAGGRIAQADEQQRQIFALARKQWNATEPAMQDTAARYADWLRGAYLAGVDRERYARLVALLALFDSLIAEAEQEAGAESRVLLPYLRGRLDAVYLITVYPGESRAGSTTEVGTDPGEGKLDLIRFLELKRDAFREGERTAARIQAILTADTQANDLERAEALLAQADWYQWHRRAAQSLPLYEQAWQLAGETNAPWRREQLGSPLELPAGIVFQPGRLPLPERSDTELRLRFGVSRQGRVQDVTWLPGPAPEQPVQAQALALLDALRFRPRLDAGRVADTPAIERSYHMRH